MRCIVVNIQESQLSEGGELGKQQEMRKCYSLKVGRRRMATTTFILFAGPELENLSIYNV